MAWTNGRACAGAGKTTQIPQYLRAAGWTAGGRRVACTQVLLHLHITPQCGAVVQFPPLAAATDRAFWGCCTRSLGAWRRWASRRAWRRSWALRWAGRSATPSASRRSPRRCVAWGKMLPSAGVTSGLVRPYAGCSRETNTAITAFNCGSLATRHSVSQHQQQCSDCCLTQHYGGCALQRQVVVPTAAPMAPTFISLSEG